MYSTSTQEGPLGQPSTYNLKPVGRPSSESTAAAKESGRWSRLRSLPFRSTTNSNGGKPEWVVPGEKGLESLQPRDLRDHGFHDHDRGRRRDRAPLDLGQHPSRGCWWPPPPQLRKNGSVQLLSWLWPSTRSARLRGGAGRRTKTIEDSGRPPPLLRRLGYALNGRRLAFSASENRGGRRNYSPRRITPSIQSLTEGTR